MAIVKQAAREGLYTSDVIGGRYQVLESDIFRGSFFVFNLATDDIIRSRDGSTTYFDNLGAATAVAEGIALPVEAKSKLAKPAKVVVPKAPKAEKATKEPKAIKPPKVPREIIAGVVDVRERKERKGSMLSIIRGLIREGGSDDEVFAKLKSQHPKATYGLKTIIILRKEMGLA